MFNKALNLDWVFFDLGSTLTNESVFEKYMLGYVYKSLKNSGINLNKKAFNKALRIVIEERRFGSGGYRSIVMELALCFTKDKSLLQKIIEGYDTDVSKKYREMQVLYPECIGVLKKLGDKYGLGLVANQPKEAKQHLLDLGLVDCLEVIVLSDDVGFSKPDPRIFLHALELAGCPPKRAMMVGDRLDNDIAPAKSIGMKTVRVKRGIMKYQKPSTGIEIADHEISTLKGLLKILYS